MHVAQPTLYGAGFSGVGSRALHCSAQPSLGALCSLPALPWPLPLRLLQQQQPCIRQAQHIICQAARRSSTAAKAPDDEVSIEPLRTTLLLVVWCLFASCMHALSCLADSQRACVHTSQRVELEVQRYWEGVLENVTKPTAKVMLAGLDTSRLMGLPVSCRSLATAPCLLDLHGFCALMFYIVMGLNNEPMMRYRHPGLMSLGARHPECCASSRRSKRSIRPRRCSCGCVQGAHVANGAVQLQERGMQGGVCPGVSRVSL